MWTFFGVTRSVAPAVFFSERRAHLIRCTGARRHMSSNRAQKKKLYKKKKGRGLSVGEGEGASLPETYFRFLRSLTSLFIVSRYNKLLETHYYFAVLYSL